MIPSTFRRDKNVDNAKGEIKLNERRMKMKKKVMKKKGEGGRDRVDLRLLQNSRCSKVDEHSGLCGSWEEGEGEVGYLLISRQYCR